MAKEIIELAMDVVITKATLLALRYDGYHNYDYQIEKLDKIEKSLDKYFDYFMEHRND